MQKLAARRATAPHRDFLSPVPLGLMHLADERGENMRGVQIEIVIRPIEIRRHPGDEVFSILAGISLAELDAGDLCDRIRIVRRFQWTGEQRILRERLGGHFWINARTAEEEEFRHAKVGCGLDDIVLNREVLDKELDRLLEIGGYAPHPRGGIDHIVRTLDLEETTHGGAIHKVKLLPCAGEDVLKACLPEPPDNGTSDHATMPRHKNFRRFFHAAFLADSTPRARWYQPARRPTSSVGCRNE